MYKKFSNKIRKSYKLFEQASRKLYSKDTNKNSKLTNNNLKDEDVTATSSKFLCDLDPG